MPPRRKTNYADIYSYEPQTELYYATRTIHGKSRKFRSKDPEKLHEKILAALDAPPPIPTFREVAEEWREQKWPTIQRNTQICYESSYDRAVEYLGDRLITEITPAEVSRVIQRMAGQGYSLKTVKTQKGVIRMIFSHAIIHDPPYILTNPADYVSIPRGLPREKRDAPDDATMQKIIDSVHTAYFGLFPYLLL